MPSNRLRIVGVQGMQPNKFCVQTSDFATPTKDSKITSAENSPTQRHF